jgi:hypothetical protein
MELVVIVAALLVYWILRSLVLIVVRTRKISKTPTR